MSKKFHIGFILLISSFMASTAEAAVRCRLHLGNDCSGTILYELVSCKRITGLTARQRCEELCKASKPICNVSDFDEWVKADALWGDRDGLKGELGENADLFDEDGVLLYSSEKTMTLCMQSRWSAIGTWRHEHQKVPVTCPRAKGASPDTCTAGTVFNPTRGICEVKEASCGAGSGSGMGGIASYSSMLVETQNTHFNPSPEVDRNAGDAQAATGGTTLPGLIDPSLLVGKASQSASASTSGGTRSGGVGSAGLGSPSDSSSGAGLSVMEGGTSGVASDAKHSAASGTQMASVAIGGSEAYGSGGSAGRGSDAYPGTQSGSSGIGSGASWFSAGSVVPSKGGEQLEFGAQAAGANRSLASIDGALVVEDPADYFMMSDIDESLFKRVTAQCRKKEKGLVLNSAMK